MIIVNSTLPVRGHDQHGAGYYGASRGSRTHRGVDFACYPQTAILAPVVGVVSKIGYPYSDDLSFRYVQITANNLHYRVFYIEPNVMLLDEVTLETHIGMSQDLTHRYEGITNHVHFEVKDENGEYLNPEDMV